MRVSTAYLNSSVLDRLMKGNEQMKKVSDQVSSGMKASRFQDMAGEVQGLLSLQDVKGNLDQYVSNMKGAAGRISSMENAMQGMVDLVATAANLWTQARSQNSAASRAAMAPQAEGLANSFFNLLRTKFDGHYMFSGMGSEQSPITAAPTANTFPGDPPPTTYYAGDTQKMRIVTAAGITQDYGVTGDDVTFARLKAGFEALWFGLQSNSTADIDGAMDLLNKAQQGLSGLMGEVGGQQAGFDLLMERHTNASAFMQENIDAIEKVDIADAMTRFSQEQSMLEASMSVMAKLKQLSLLNYLQ